MIYNDNDDDNKITFINSYVSNAYFLFTLKTSENLKVFCLLF